MTLSARDVRAEAALALVKKHEITPWEAILLVVAPSAAVREASYAAVRADEEKAA